jgi:hypothetical protein
VNVGTPNAGARSTDTGDDVGATEPSLATGRKDSLAAFFAVARKLLTILRDQKPWQAA